MSFESSEDDIDNDYVPESLMDFVKQADAALSEQTQLFLDEILPSSPRDHSMESSIANDTSDMIQSLQNDMDKINLFDSRSPQVLASGRTMGYDSDDLASPPLASPRNPAADLTYTQGKRQALGTPGSEMEEKKTNQSEPRPPQLEDSSNVPADAESTTTMHPAEAAPGGKCEKSPPKAKGFLSSFFSNNPSKDEPEKPSLDSQPTMDNRETSEPAMVAPSADVSFESANSPENHEMGAAARGIAALASAFTTLGIKSNSESFDNVSFESTNPQLNGSTKHIVEESMPMAEAPVVQPTHIQAPSRELLSSYVDESQSNSPAYHVPAAPSLPSDSCHPQPTTQGPVSTLEAIRTTVGASVASYVAVDRAQLGPTSRLVQPTAASLGHVQSVEKKGTRTSRIPAPGTFISSNTGTLDRAKMASPLNVQHWSPARPITRASPAGSAHSNEKRMYTTPTQARNRFMNPTAAMLAHSSAKASSTGSASGTDTKRRDELTVPQVPSRLMRETAASKARINTGTSPPSHSPQKRSRATEEEAVIRARERIRHRQLQEASKFQTGHAQFNMGSKPMNPKQKGKPSGERKGPQVAKGASPNFATPTSATIAHQQTQVFSMAESGSFFGKYLRGDTSPTSTASTEKHGLTVPKVSSRLMRGTAVLGPQKRRSEDDRKSITMAQSTSFLVNSLRGSPGVPSVKRTSGLTQPQSPKFHTIHKRALPKSTAEIEAEQMADIRSHPFKANQMSAKPLHTGSSAGLSKVPKRNLTKPEPFNLSSGSRSIRRKEADDWHAKNEYMHVSPFVAQPLPASSSATKKRTVATPKPIGFAVDMTSKVSSPAKGKRSPSSFKARPVPKSTFQAPSIPVHHLPPRGTGGQHVHVETFRALPYKGPPPEPVVSKQTHPPTTPEPFKLESVQRHEAFQELLQEKVEREESEFQKSLVHKALPLPKSTYQPVLPSTRFTT